MRTPKAERLIALGDGDSGLTMLRTAHLGGGCMTIRRRVALEDAFSAEERELLHELVDALRTLRYGSLLLTVHDGQIVEIQKTEKIRTKSMPAQASQKPSISPTGGS